MSNINNIAVLFHAYNLDAGFSSTKISQVFKSLSDRTNCVGSTIFEIKNKIAKTVGLPSDSAWKQALEEIQVAADTGIQVFTFLDHLYPADLKQIEDPPLVLFISGRSKIGEGFWESFDRISIVGSRSTSQYGMTTGTSLSKQLVWAGNSIVSGLAYGIDKSAHEGALTAAREISRRGAFLHPCPTISVLGAGLLELYPKAHVSLAEEITEVGGMLMSEYGLYLKPRTYLFPRRNRIVSGLSNSVVIVEAMKKSGSLITARLAVEQNKELYCVPGPIDSPFSEGVNELIRDGAGVIANINDFVELKKSKKIDKELISDLTRIEMQNDDSELTAVQRKLHMYLKNSRYTFDELLEMDLATEETLRFELYDLEMKDVVVSKDGYYGIK